MNASVGRQHWTRFAVALVAATVMFLMPLEWLERSLEASQHAWWDALPVDKFVHWIVLAGLAWLGLTAIAAGPPQTPEEDSVSPVSWLQFWALLGGLVLYASVVELVQPMIAHRGREVLDVVAGALGCLAAGGVWSRRYRSQ